MKQTLILRFYAIFALICYFSVLGFYYWLNGSFYPLWFSLAIFLISIYSLLRGVFFALDSATWLGLFLFFIASIGAFNVIFGLKNWEIVCLCFFFAGLSSILVGFTYKNILLFKISFLLLLETLVILLYIISIISLFGFIVFSSLLAFGMLIKFINVLHIGSDIGKTKKPDRK